MEFFDLPDNVVILGEMDETGGYSIRLCGGRGIVVLALWRSENEARAALAPGKSHVPLLTVDRNKLILELAEKRLCTHVYVNPKSTEPIILQDTFSLTDLDRMRVIRINDFEAVWPIAATFLGNNVDQATHSIIKQTWKENQHISFSDACQLALDIVNRCCSEMRKHTDPAKQRRASWPLLRPQLIAAGADDATLEFIRETWDRSPELSFSEVLTASQERVDAMRMRVDDAGAPAAVCGFVYILINPSMPGLVKIGHSMRSPEDRARELSSATGVPVPYTVAYFESVVMSEEVEKEIHRRLERFRFNRNREFFSISVREAIQVVAEVAKRYQLNP